MKAAHHCRFSTADFLSKKEQVFMPGPEVCEPVRETGTGLERSRVTHPLRPVVRRSKYQK